MKSLLGERLDIGELGSGKTTRRFRRLAGLFDLRARSDRRRVLVALPDGQELEVQSGSREPSVPTTRFSHPSSRA